MKILRELLYHPKARFSDLNVSDLSSDHFTYHINCLIRDKLVIKTKGTYKLSPNGKEFANTMDTDQSLIEKQGKIGVLVIATRAKDKT